MREKKFRAWDAECEELKRQVSRGIPVIGVLSWDICPSCKFYRGHGDCWLLVKLTVGDLVERHGKVLRCKKYRQKEK